MLHERIYLNENDDRVYIDTYVPNDRTKLHDAILVIPGGGYIAVCTEREGEPIALDFVARDYAAFVLNYRVGKGDRFPSQLLDAGAAMLHIRNNAEKYGVNPKRVFAVGFSAGGHLCGSIASMYAYAEVKEAYGEEYLKVKPTGAILSYPVTVMDTEAHYGSFINLTGKEPNEFTEKDYDKYSLDRVVNSDTAPMYIWHTRTDDLVPVEGSIRLALALSRCGVNYMLHIAPYGPHGLALSNKVTLTPPLSDVFAQSLMSDWTAKADEWFATLPDSEF